MLSEMYDLKSNVQVMRIENEELRHTLQDAYDVTMRYETELSAMKEERKKNSRALASMAQLKQKADLADELKSRVDELQQLLSSAEQDADTQRQWYEQSQERCSELEEQLADVRAHMDALEQSSKLSESNFRKQLTSLQMQLDAVAQENAQIYASGLRENLDEILASNDIERLRHQLRLLVEESDELIARQMEDMKKIRELEEMIANLLKTRDDLRTRNQSLESSVLEFQKQISALEAERTVKNREVDRLKQEIEKLEREVETRAEELSSVVVQGAEVVDNLTAQVTHLQSELAVEKKKIELVESVKASREKAELEVNLREKLVDGVTSSEELKSQLVEALHAVEQVQSELAKVAEEKEQVEVKSYEQNEKLHKEVLESQILLQQAERAVEEAKNDLVAIKNVDPDRYVLRELEILRAERDELERRLQETELSLEDWRQKQLQTVKNRENRRVDAGVDSQGIQLLNEQIDSLKKRIAQLEQDNDSLRQSQIRRNDSDKSELDDLRLLLALAEDNASDLKARNLELEAMIQQRRRIEDSAEVEIASKTDHLNLQLRELEQKCEAINRSKDVEIAEKTETLKCHLREVEQKCEALEKVEKDKAEQLERVQSEVAEVRRDRQALSDGLGMSHLQDEVDKARSERDRLQTELLAVSRDSQAAMLTRQKTIDRLRATVARLTAENQRWCDCLTGQFEYHKQIFQTANQPPDTPAVSAR